CLRLLSWCCALRMVRRQVSLVSEHSTRFERCRANPQPDSRVTAGSPTHECRSTLGVIDGLFTTDICTIQPSAGSIPWDASHSCGALCHLRYPDPYMLHAGRATASMPQALRCPILLLFLGATAETLPSKRHGAGHHESEVDSSGAVTPGRRMMRAESHESLAHVSRHYEDPEDELYKALASQLGDMKEKPGNASAVPVDCQWYDWSPWSFCSKTCGTGTYHRKRTVAVQDTSGGKTCTGDDQEFGDCNEIPCPVECEWGDWTQWSDCSASCDGGVRQREKPVLVESKQDEHSCKLEDGVQTGECSTQRCSHDCAWGDWSSWSSCSASCAGGTKNRTREVRLPAVEDGKQCDGDKMEEMSCNLKACPVDCVIADWSRWEPCSATCGNGTKTRRRVAEIQATAGGSECSGPFTEETECSEGGCPVHCVWDDWSGWSSCSVSCGGTATFSSSLRRRLVTEANGGVPCLGDEAQRRPCGEENCPVDCKWSDWSEWNQCTKTCGGGLTERLRNSTGPTYGGQECDGASRDVMSCSPTPCPVDCKLSDWSPWTECSLHCGNGTALRFRAEANSAEHGGKACKTDRLHEVAACLGSDCKPTGVLIKSGQVTQVTGVMQVVTEDPVGFASNPMYALVAREAIRQFATEDVERVHVSVQPAQRYKPGPPRTANVWFSMLVPKDKNVTTVRGNLTDTDTLTAGRVLRQMLRKSGMYIFTNVTKFLVSMPRPKPVVKKVMPEPKNMTRVVCFMKLLVPQPLLFAETDPALAAVQRSIAETADVADDGVHVSLMPDMMLKTQKVDSQQKSGPKAPLDSWFTLMAPAKHTIPEADEEALSVAKRLNSVGQGGISARLKANLIAADLQAWDSSEVKTLICKAEVSGWDQEPVAFDQRVTGVVQLALTNPRQFSQDARAEQGTRQAIAEIADVPQDRVQVSLMPGKATMDDEAMLLQFENQDVEVSNTDEDEVSAWYLIIVPATPVDGAWNLAHKLNSLDLSLAELKLQDLLMDQGVSEGVKILSFTAQSGSAVSQLKHQDELEGDAELPPAKSEPSGEASSTTLSAEEDIEPPTVSSPGGGDEEGDDKVPSSQEIQMRIRMKALGRAET
ncbi:unnamed protein product, partial [Effrenium voratum]